MLTAPPILRQILSDTKLPTRALQVWMRAVEELDLLHFGPLKQAAMAHEMDIGEATVWRAITVLVDQGYLESADGPIYRVPFSRRAAAIAADTTAQEPASTVEDAENHAHLRRKRARVVSKGVL